MGYWKSFARVGSATLVGVGLFFVACWQLSVHPVVTGIILAVFLILFFVSLMALIWA